MVLAPLTTGAWLMGALAVAISLRRGANVHFALGLPLAWPASLLLFRFGGDVCQGTRTAEVLALGEVDAVTEEKADRLLVGD